MKIIPLIIIVSMLYACSVNTSKEIDIKKVTFNYRDDAYIFFRNMRQTNYDLEVLEDAGWRIYRHEDYTKDSSINEFKTALVVNWKVNKVYPIIELQKSLQKEGLEITWEDPETQAAGTMALGGLRRNEEMKLLTQIYNHIMNEHQFYWKPDGKKSVPLFSSSDQKEAFRVSMYDFYRLTGLL